MHDDTGRKSGHDRNKFDLITQGSRSHHTGLWQILWLRKGVWKKRSARAGLRQKRELSHHYSYLKFKHNILSTPPQPYLSHNSNAGGPLRLSVFLSSSSAGNRRHCGHNLSVFSVCSWHLMMMDNALGFMLNVIQEENTRLSLSIYNYCNLGCAFTADVHVLKCSRTLAYCAIDFNLTQSSIHFRYGKRFSDIAVWSSLQNT